MTFTKGLFVGIDKLCDGIQNNAKATKYKDKHFVINEDIVYDEANKDVCLLDTYHIEQNEGKYPVFFYIHGGGFVAGDKRYRRGLSRWMAARGFYVVNVNYSLAPEMKFPAPILNLVSAMNWVRDNADALNLDLDNMIVSGDSAGGYFSSALSVISYNKNLQEELGVSTDVKFKAAVLNCGIYDVGRALLRKMPFKFTDRLLFDLAGITRAEYDNYKWKSLCSTVDLVTKDFPATFLISAKKDIFCAGQGEMMIEKLQKEGVHVEVFTTTKLLDNHCFSLFWTTKAAKENLIKLNDFLNRFKEGKIA